MTSKERITNILHRKKTDRIGLMEGFWSDTHITYVDGGHIQPDESLNEHFNLDIASGGWLNYTADLDFEPVAIAEDSDTITTKDGNGAILRRHKNHDTTPEHIAYTVTCREEWEEIRHFYTNIDERRIPFADYREAKKKAEERNRFFTASGVNVFEFMHPICGHENMLIGMIDDPGWIHDMCDVFANMHIALLEILFEKEGLPDAYWYFEDMGFKEKPFMSPAMYRELIKPTHKKTMDFLKSKNLPAIMHSCGFVEPLLPDMVDAGIACLQAMENKAGMDLLRIYKNFGDRIALCGGIDVRVLYSNDRGLIDAELEKKIPIVKQGHAYILHSDHSIPATVNYETVKYFIQKGLELGTY